MKPQLNWHEYGELELIPAQSQPTIWQRFSLKFNELWQKTLAHLQTSSEPYVWQTKTEQGQSVWNAYDPLTHCSIERASMNEVRIWLEERHYRTT